MLKDKIKIILITFNRKDNLKKTFKQIFAENSPIKDFDITVLDNASTDGTSELIEEYKLKFPNITHIRHKINIGGNANICRAFEMGATSRKEYFWVLCDDDKYDFSAWDEIENAILSNKYYLIYTSRYIIRNNKDIAQLAHQATFVPGCIYFSGYMTDEIMQNMYNTINTMFCQIMISSEIICNEEDRIFVPSKSIVDRGIVQNETHKTIIRGRKEEFVHPDTNSIFWHIGFIKAIQIVRDKKKRDYIVQKVRFTDYFNQSFFSYMNFIIRYNQKNKKGNLKNIVDLFFYLNFYQKIILIISYICCTILGRVIMFYTNEKGLYVELLGTFKTKLFPCISKKLRSV